MPSMQRLTTRERGSATPLKVSMFLHFQIFQAIIVFIVASSYV
jgi:hypothetical protein